MQIKLEGAILELITDLFIIDDGFSVGEKLTQIEKTAKKRFYDMTNEDIYNALVEVNNSEYYQDEYDAK